MFLSKHLRSPSCSSESYEEFKSSSHDVSILKRILPCIVVLQIFKLL